MHVQHTHMCSAGCAAGLVGLDKGVRLMKYYCKLPNAFDLDCYPELHHVFMPVPTSCMHKPAESVAASVQASFAGKGPQTASKGLTGGMGTKQNGSSFCKNQHAWQRCCISQLKLMYCRMQCMVALVCT